MADSKARIVFHFVWSTKERMPWITPERERDVFAVIGAQVDALGCRVLALNGMPDHVHLLLSGARTASCADIMSRVKGASSHFMNAQNKREEIDAHFQWQDGYGVFTLGYNQIDSIATYVAQQKQRHARGGKYLWKSLEIDQ